MSIESLEAEFLKVSLERLPCDDNLQPSITLDLNGQIIVRGKPAGQTRPTELILSRSQWQGDQVAVNMNRQYLARALKLGFREVCLFGPNAPVLCDDGRRQYMWALLDAEATIRPCDQAIRIESLTQAVRPPTPSIQSTQKRFNVTTPATKLPSMRRQPRPAGHQQAIDDNNGNRSSTMVNQAIAVRTMLRETLIHTNELIRGLKRELRQNRLLASTLTSLKQLQKVAG